MPVGSRRDRGNENAPRYTAELFRYRQGDRHSCDADMAAGANIVVVEHVAEAATDEGRPGRRRLEPEAEYGTFRSAAQRLDTFCDYASLMRGPPPPDHSAPRASAAIPLAQSATPGVSRRICWIKSTSSGGSAPNERVDACSASSFVTPV